MPSTFGLIVAVFVGLPAASSVPRVDGLEAPLAEHVRKIGPSTLTRGDVVARCRVHAQVVVIEMDDPGKMGAVEIRMRGRSGDANSECTAKEEMAHRLVPSDTAYVEGVRGPWLLLRGADAHGAEMKLHLVDTRTGKETWSTVRMTTAAATVTMDKDGRATLDYVAALDVECDPRAKGCIDRVRAKNNVAADVALTFALDRCEPRGKITHEDVLQLGVPARIDDLATPSPRFVAGALACAASP